MTKGEFLAALREKLTGEVSPREIEKQILYYERYISDEIQKGRSEAEVLEELGSPLLIAKTIADTCGQETGSIYETYAEHTGYERQGQPEGQFKAWKVSGWTLLGVVLVILLLLFVLFRILLPVLVPIVLIGIIVSLIKRRG